jgi:aspartyl/glutamyl-tRNA(Asn/Gln) amidotransferase C subunit
VTVIFDAGGERKFLVHYAPCGLYRRTFDVQDQSRRHCAPGAAGTHHLAPDEVEPSPRSSTGIVAMVESLQAVDVSGVEPTLGMSHESHPRASTRARTDVVTPGLDRAVVLAQAPDATKEFFRVPRVIGRGEES